MKEDDAPQLNFQGIAEGHLALGWTPGVCELQMQRLSVNE